MNYSKTTIMDKNGFIISVTEAARILKIPVGAMRGRLWRWRHRHPNADIAHLERLRIDVKTIAVVHDGVVKEIRLVDLVRLCGVTRSTVERYVHEYQRQHPNMPIVLKPFIVRLQKGKEHGRPLKIQTRTPDENGRRYTSKRNS